MFFTWSDADPLFATCCESLLLRKSLIFNFGYGHFHIQVFKLDISKWIDFSFMSPLLFDFRNSSLSEVIETFSVLGLKSF